MNKKKLKAILIERIETAIDTVDITHCGECELEQVLGHVGREFVNARVFNPRTLKTKKDSTK